jgi:hypothetical protein
MSNDHIAGHAAKLAAAAVKELAPLRKRKNVFLALVMGFVFGPLGVAVYFGSIKDFFVCFGMLLFFSFLLVFGPGELIGWLFSAGYAAWRAHTSNEKLAIA